MILFISWTSWVGASFRTEATKLPIGRSLVDGSGVSKPVTKEGREGSDCWAQQSRSVSETFGQTTCKWVSCMKEGSLRILLCSWYMAMWSFDVINVRLWWKPQRRQAAHGALALGISDPSSSQQATIAFPQSPWQHWLWALCSHEWQGQSSSSSKKLGFPTHRSSYYIYAVPLTGQSGSLIGQQQTFPFTLQMTCSYW